MLAQDRHPNSQQQTLQAPAENNGGLTMTKYNNPRYKPDRKVSNFDSNQQTIRRLYVQAIGRKSLSTAKRIRLKGLWTDVMLELLSRGNSDVLKSFHYRLEMDEINEREEMHQK